MHGTLLTKNLRQHEQHHIPILSIMKYVWILNKINRENIKYQLVPSYTHWANQAEHQYRPLTTVLLGVRSTVDPDFPLAQWDLLLFHVNLNLKFQSTQSNPTWLAHAYFIGNFDFSTTLLVPPGTRGIAFKYPKISNTWASHGEERWYVGPTFKHYRCITIYFPKTRSTRTVDTVRYSPKLIIFPKTTLEDHLRQVSSNTVSIITNQTSQIIPEILVIKYKIHY